MQQTSDCVFVLLPDSDGPGSLDYHLGSSYIISYLRSYGFKALQIAQKEPLRIKDLISKILDFRPKIIGFTVFDATFAAAAMIAGEIKKASSSTLIVFGGPCPSVHHSFIMERHPFVDACFINDSEESFHQFISKLAEAGYNYEKADLSGITGLSFRFDKTKHTAPSKTFRQHSPDFLDKYPSPYLTGAIPASEGYITGIITSRGCNQNCVYCNCSVISGKRVSTHSFNRVISEVDMLSRSLSGKRILPFQDDAFSLLPGRAATICRAIIDNKIKARLSCVTRCDRVDEDLLELMREAGFVSITFSLESANPLTLRRIGKVHVAEDYPSGNLEREVKFIESFERMTACAKRKGFENVTASIMVGLPWETLKEARHTIDVIHKNESIDYYAHNYLKISKGTPLHNSIEKYGYKLRFIDDNPVFSKMIYPKDVRNKVFISPKSHLHAVRKTSGKVTLSILSMGGSQNKEISGFKSIILYSDRVTAEFASWLREVLVLNGTIVQVYSDEKAMRRMKERNCIAYLKYSPGFNIINYCIRKKEDIEMLVSAQSLNLKSDSETENIKICDFGYFLANENAGISFIRTVCRERDREESLRAYSFLDELSSGESPLLTLAGKKPLPYFENLCKWTAAQANCITHSCLLINEKYEVRFCWYGEKAGEAGQSYETLISGINAERQEVAAARRCGTCIARDSCVKCPHPFPLSAQEYCSNKVKNDVAGVTGLIKSLDQLKQLVQ